MKTYLKHAVLTLFISFAAVGMCACSYSKEERQRMAGIEEQGIINAVAYVEEKYGFTPKTKEVKLCMERGDGDPKPWANGYEQALMSDGEKEFTVHISGEGKSTVGQD